MKSFFRSLLLFVLCLSFICPAVSLATDEEEVSLFSVIDEATPAPAETPAASDTATAPVDALNPEMPAATLAPTANETMADGSVNIAVTAAGDMTIGKNARSTGKSMFDKEMEKQGGDPSFIIRNMQELFSKDDMTLVNFEGTLTTAGVPSNKKNNQFLFSAPPEYVDILKNGSIEAVSFENNHVMDHGEEGYKETTDAFDQAGVIWSAEQHMGVFNVKGVSIAMLAYQTFNGRYPDLFEKVPHDVAEAKKKYDIVIVSYHWGNELDYKPNKNQVKLGRLTIDAGADLVLGHHSHRINPIERYKDKLIVYSLGNFSFAGNNKPQDMCTYIFQIKFNVKDGQATTAGFRIVPSRISSKSDYNDMIPTPFTEQRQIESVISVLKSNGKNLEYAVDSYPTEWE